MATFQELIAGVPPQWWQTTQPGSRWWENAPRQMPPPTATLPDTAAPQDTGEITTPDTAQPTLGMQSGPPTAGGLGQGGGGPPAGGGLLAGIQANKNALAGLGLGLMGGGTMWNKFAGAQEGYQQGARADIAQAQQLEAARQHAVENAMAERRMALAEAPQAHIVQGDFGPEVITIDPRTGKVVGGGVGAAGGSELGRMDENYDENGRDRAYLNAVRDRYGAEAANEVEAMADGRIPASGRINQKLVKFATRYSKDFNSRTYLEFLQAEKSFMPGGRDSDKVRAINQAIMHADAAWNLSEKLGGYSILPSGWGGGLLNQAYQGMQATGDTPEARQYQSDLAEYNGVASALGQELIAAAKTGSDVKAAHERADALKGARTPAERRGAIKGAMTFLEGAHTALEEKRASGREAGFKMRPLIDPENQAKFDRIRNYEEGQSTPSSGAATTGAGGGAGGAAAPPAAALPPGRWGKTASGRRVYRTDDGQFLDEQGRPIQ